MIKEKDLLQKNCAVNMRENRNTQKIVFNKIYKVN